MARSDAAEVVIVKIRRDDPEDEGRHTGTWKIAYADFVTAMMAFFLLMWLINATTKEQKTGISEYFNPIALATGASGSDGMLAGRVSDQAGSMASASGRGDKAVPAVTPPEMLPAADARRLPETESPPAVPARSEATVPPEEAARGPVESTVAAVRGFIDPFTEQLGSVGERGSPSATAGDEPGTEAAAFERIERDLQQKIRASIELRGLADKVLIDRSEEGLRIQIVEGADFQMFPIGSGKPTEQAVRLLEAVASVIGTVPNGIAVTGHTDGRPYASKDGYGNWELSADRANAARRVLEQTGLEAARLVRIEGRGDREHLIGGAPNDPRNRRIGLLLLKAKP